MEFGGHRRAAATALVAALTTTLATAILVAAPAQAADARRSHEQRFLDYAVMGDSITAGAGTSDWTFLPDGGYVRVDHHWGYGEQAHIRAYGVPAACVAGDWCAWGSDGADLAALRWFPETMAELRHRPRVVVTHIGINDLATHHTAAEVIAGLRQLRQEGREQDIRVVFGTVGPSPESDPYFAVGQAERLKLNDWIRRSQGTYVDYARALEGPDGWLRPEFESALHDVHYNDAGAAAMAAALRAWVETDAGTHGRASSR